MGIFKKRTTLHCPNCQEEIPMTVCRIGRFERRDACFKCGARFEITSNFGTVTIRRSWGFQGMPADGSHLPLPDLSKPDGWRRTDTERHNTSRKLTKCAFKR